MVGISLLDIFVVLDVSNRLLMSASAGLLDVGWLLYFVKLVA